ncbi:hypothetical protein LJY25_20620 [Hymenobacter sp. BT175]|uniref:hypothetical protein n=1 Tax=Hymenobacter translucens TaxID=2886507 RepID=UPI001D0EB0C1|nr:hypothetical protein [Hymenobacter translucens]MCC2548865.1 hypothetical protein [Hymenobacter translucens]
MNYRYVIICPALLALPGCVALNSHQTGRTLGKDAYLATASLNAGKLDAHAYSLSSDSSKTSYFVVGEASAKYGVNERVDVGVRVNTSTQLTLTGKAQIAGTQHSRFASSVGLEAGASPVALLMLQTLSYSGSVASFSSVHMNEKLTFTFSPRYTFLRFSNLTRQYGFTESSHIYGYSVGVIWGRQHQFSAEFSQYTSNQRFSFAQHPQISIAYLLNGTD